MAESTQRGQPIAVEISPGDDTLLLEGFSGVEAISEPFRFNLDLLSQAHTPIAFDQLLGRKITVMIALPGGKSRPINGVVVRLSQGPQIRSTPGPATFIRYRTEIVPQLWLLTRKVQSRIFQGRLKPPCGTPTRARPRTSTPTRSSSTCTGPSMHCRADRSTMNRTPCESKPEQRGPRLTSAAPLH